MKEESIKISFTKIKKFLNNICSKIDIFFSHRENIFFIIFIIALIFIHEYLKISQETGTLFFSIWLIFFLVYFFLFTLEKTEQFLLNKITWILILSIIIIIKYQNYFGITNKDIFFMIGAIFAFWYGYKKYNQDKELEIIEKYTKKYNSIGAYIGFKTQKIINDDIKGDVNKKFYYNILQLWYEEFYLYQRGYISENLWKDWSIWIQRDIEEFLMNDLVVYEFHESEFIKILNIEYVGNNLPFTDFIIKKIEKISQNYKNLIKNLYTDKNGKVEEGGKCFLKVIHTLEKTIGDITEAKKSYNNLKLKT